MIGVVSPEPAEHEHRQADAGDDGRGVCAGARLGSSVARARGSASGISPRAQNSSCRATDYNLFLLRLDRRASTRRRTLRPPPSASPTASGCGWIVSLRSAAVAPISTASTASAISSPAPGPTMPTPRTRSVFGSMTSLVTPSVRSSVIARPDAPHGKRVDGDLALLLRGLVFGQAAPRDFGIGEDDGGNGRRLERDALAENRVDGDARFVRRLVREHRLADDVADRVDRRLGRRPRLVDLDEPALVHLDARLVEAGHRGIRAAADRHEHAIERLLVRHALGQLAFERDRMPSFASLTAATLVFSSTASQIALMRLARMFTRSRSAPGQQAVGHLDDRDLRAERGVDAARVRGRCSRRRRRAATSGRRADRARAVESITRGLSIESPGTVAGLEPVAMIACSNASVLVVPSDLGDVERLGVAERRRTLDVVDLAELGDLADAAGQLRARPCP